MIDCRPLLLNSCWSIITTPILPWAFARVCQAYGHFRSKTVRHFDTSAEVCRLFFTRHLGLLQTAFQMFQYWCCGVWTVQTCQTSAEMSWCGTVFGLKCPVTVCHSILFLNIRIIKCVLIVCCCINCKCSAIFICYQWSHIANANIAVTSVVLVCLRTVTTWILCISDSKQFHMCWRICIIVLL